MPKANRLTLSRRPDTMARKVLEEHPDKSTAAQKLFCSPELISTIVSQLDKDSLARLAGISRLWYLECARRLWSSCHGLQNLENHVWFGYQDNIAQLIRHLEIDCAQQVWSGNHLLDTPRFPNLRSVNLYSQACDTPTSGVAPSISITRDEFLLDMLSQSHLSLRFVDLNINLAFSLRGSLKQFLLRTAAVELRLGPLLHRAIDDSTTAALLSKTRLRSLEMHTPITLRCLNKLRDSDSTLPHLAKLTIAFDINTTQTMASLFLRTPNVTVLDATLEFAPNNSIRAADAVFLTICSLQHLHTLYIRMKTVPARDSNHEQVCITITGADLVSLTRLPLKRLAIEPSHISWNNLELVQVTGGDLSYVLRAWDHIDNLNLFMSCKEVVCDQQQAEEIVYLVSRMSMQFFYIGDLIVEEDDEIDPYVWLGSNLNFCPDPFLWEYRSLHHSAHVQSIEYVREEAEEDEYLVWGAQHESHDDDESVSEHLIEHSNDEDNALVEENPIESTASNPLGTSEAERDPSPDCFTPRY
jgi:hypothetical protein